MSDNYKELLEAGSGEIAEKKSRFIATMMPVKSEEEAIDFINSIKKKYWDARHNCYAYTIGDNNELTRCSDDGEPSQTAGRPMLDVLLLEELHNVAVVVTRYFGGTLLGTGGLVRAYQGAVKEAINNSVIATKVKGSRIYIEVDYGAIGKIQYILSKRDIKPENIMYEQNVRYEINVIKDQIESFKNEVVEAMNGNVKFDIDKEIYFYKN